MKWSDVFPNPNDVGQSEYRAIHDVVAMGLDIDPDAGYPGDLEISAEARPHVCGMLVEILNWSEGLLERLGAKKGAPGNEEVEKVQSGLHVVEKGPFAPEVNGSELILSVASSSIQALHRPEAKKLAYADRAKHGFENAGIEKFEGPLPVTTDYEPDREAKTANNPYAGWVMRFRLTRGL